MMGARLVPLTIVAALTALATAAMAAGMTPSDPRWWPAAVHLAVLGGLTPMIYAVNFRIVPVFSRRAWARPRLLAVQVAMALPGAWLTALGIRLSESWLESLGAALALAGGMLFMANLAMLFRQPVTSPELPLPFEQQTLVDRTAIRFSQMSSVYLLLGLGVGLVTSLWTPDIGRWELVWAHAMLVGFVVSMATSVTYHVLPRWTTARWKTPALIRWHFVVTAIALPLMLIALARDWSWLFKIAGPLQATAFILWIVNILPLALSLSRPTRAAFAVAFGFLAIGISLGVTFAVDPAKGAIYRQVHAEMNLFGWAGLLILGVGYYLFPRFAGSPLRWPRLASLQIAVLALSVFLGALLVRLHVSGHGDFERYIRLAHLTVAATLASFALQAAMTFRSKPGTVVTMQLSRSQPRLQ
jgi:hypothetical protein